MKKIMFNDRYGLTQAVLEGKKIMTRRLMTMTLHKKNGKELTPVVPDDMFIASDGTAHFQVGRNGYMVPKKNQPSYHVGEEIWIAQSSRTLDISPMTGLRMPKEVINPLMSLPDIQTRCLFAVCI